MIVCSDRAHARGFPFRLSRWGAGGKLPTACHMQMLWQKPSTCRHYKAPGHQHMHEALQGRPSCALTAGGPSWFEYAEVLVVFDACAGEAEPS